MKPGKDFPVAESGDSDPQWCICNYRGECMACKIEDKVYQYFGGAGLLYLRRQVAKGKCVTVTSSPSKKLIRRTGAKSFEIVD
jgi:hypothetical protein